MRVLTSERLLAQTIGGSPAGNIYPIDLETTKRVLRFPPTSEDGLIEGWIAAADQYFRDQTGRETLAALWEYTLASAPTGNVIELPRTPVLEVVSIDTVSSYTVSSAAVGSPPVVLNPFCARGRVYAASGSWPSGGLTIRYTAGYGLTANEMPEMVKAVLYDLTRYFHSRPDAAELPMSTQVALRMFRQSASNILPLEAVA